MCRRSPCVITAFAVPSLSAPAGNVDFFVFGCLPGCPVRLVTQSTFGFAALMDATLSTVDIAILESGLLLFM